MKILIVSDSHEELRQIDKIIDKEEPSAIIWLGDHSTDGEEVSYSYEDIDFHIVRGNCDFFDRKHDDEAVLKFKDKLVFITHGHLYDVKRTLVSLEKRAKELGVHLSLFGHTHIPFNETRDGIIYFNPGALKDGNYGTLVIDDEGVQINLKNTGSNLC